MFKYDGNNIMYSFESIIDNDICINTVHSTMRMLAYMLQHQEDLHIHNIHSEGSTNNMRILGASGVPAHYYTGNLIDINFIRDIREVVLDVINGNNTLQVPYNTEDILGTACNTIVSGNYACASSYNLSLKKMLEEYVYNIVTTHMGPDTYENKATVTDIIVKYLDKAGILKQLYNFVCLPCKIVVHNKLKYMCTVEQKGTEKYKAAVNLAIHYEFVPILYNKVHLKNKEDVYQCTINNTFNILIRGVPVEKHLLDIDKYDIFNYAERAILDTDKKIIRKILQDLLSNGIFIFKKCEFPAKYTLRSYEDTWYDRGMLIDIYKQYLIINADLYKHILKPYKYFVEDQLLMSNAVEYFRGICARYTDILPNERYNMRLPGHMVCRRLKLEYQDRTKIYDECQSYKYFLDIIKMNNRDYVKGNPNVGVLDSYYANCNITLNHILSKSVKKMILDAVSVRNIPAIVRDIGTETRILKDMYYNHLKGVATGDSEIRQLFWYLINYCFNLDNFCSRYT